MVKIRSMKTTSLEAKAADIKLQSRALATKLRARILVLKTKLRETQEALDIVDAASAKSTHNSSDNDDDYWSSIHKINRRVTLGCCALVVVFCGCAMCMAPSVMPLGAMLCGLSSTVAFLVGTNSLCKK